MQKEIDIKKAEPLDFNSLETFYKEHTGKELKIIVIDELKDKTVDTIFDEGCFVLYVPVNGQYSGHFVSMFRANNKIYYLDSYGNTPQYLIKMSYEPQDNRPFFKIIKDSKIKVIYNTVKYQTLASNVDNCGRYSVLNCVLYQQHKEQGKFYDLGTFYDIVVANLKKYGYKDFDDIITRLTISI